MIFRFMEFLRCLTEGHWMSDNADKPGKVICTKCGYGRKP